MRDLIFDIGANNGDDTAFYLKKGFRVVAIEADPALAQKLYDRFAEDIAAGNVVIEGVGVSDKVSSLEFYVNSHSEWSSFVKQGKATQENEFEVIRVPTMPLSTLVQRHGASRYLKIDIEGFEKAALSTLTKDLPLPKYLSFEVNLDRNDLITMMSEIGYDAFQLVRQGKPFLTPQPNPAREGDFADIEFNSSMSGCFGRDLEGEWLDLEAMTAFLETFDAEAAEAIARGERRGWHDVHCRLQGAD